MHDPSSSRGQLESAAAVPLPDAVLDAYEHAWQRIRAPGTWWDGTERLAIVAESRNALACPLCEQRKAALSPYTVDGNHHSLGELPDRVVEIIHRLRTDSGRLRRRWYEESLASGIGDGQYVEISALVANICFLDTFARALGADPVPLPAPLPGVPSRRRPTAATVTVAWVPTVEPDAMRAGEPDPYEATGPEPVYNIQRALSLVPAEAVGWWTLSNALREPAEHDLSVAQRELVAARVSALAQCFY